MAALDIAMPSERVVNASEPTLTIPAASSLLLNGTLAGFSSIKTQDSFWLSAWAEEPELPKADRLSPPTADGDRGSFYSEVGTTYLPAFAYCSASELSWADLASVIAAGAEAPASKEMDQIGPTLSLVKDFPDAAIPESVLDDGDAISIADLLDSFVLRSIVNRGDTSARVAVLGTRPEDLPLVQNTEHLNSAALLEQLRESATNHARQSGKELLDELALNRGLAWQTIATMLGVTSAAIRKWRRGGSVAPENRAELAALVAFFEPLEQIEKPIADLGSWIEMRVRDDTTLTPAEIYRAGSHGRLLLIEWARSDVDTATMLDRFDESWREDYARDPNFRVGIGPDGARAIVPR